MPFTVSDPDTALNLLTLSRGSSNPALVPTNNIVFGGSGANRTVTVTPAAGQTGTCDDHGDGERRDEQRERHVCADGQRGEHAADDRGDRRTRRRWWDGRRRPFNFTVGDADTAVGSLTVSGSSSNPAWCRTATSCSSTSTAPPGR